MNPYDAPQVNPESPPPQRGWFRRNALWFVPTLLGLGVACVCPVACCSGTIFSIFGALQNSEAVAMAFRLVQDSPEVKERLGDPIEMGHVTGGNIQKVNDGGQATVDFTVDGPLASAQVHTEADRAGGQWSLRTVEITYSDGSKIDLYDPPPPAGEPPTP